jgi:hypothetical protein
MWLAEHAHLPGQQLILSVTDLLTTHYATAMSPYEMGSLATIDAWIEPSGGKHGFHAAEVAERQAVGPTPDPSDGERVYQSMTEFNAARAGSRDPALARKLVQPLRALYGDMVEDTWTLIWKAIDRERKRPEAASVARRVREDRIAYASHLSSIRPRLRTGFQLLGAWMGGAPRSPSSSIPPITSSERPSPTA